jgi:membrane dipeptidase
MLAGNRKSMRSAGRLLAAATLGTVLSIPVLTAADPSPDPALKHARQLLSRAILVDGHNDLPIMIRFNRQAPRDVEAYDLREHTAGQTDIPRLRAGGVGAQFWSVFIPADGKGPFARTQLEQIELARRLIQRYPDTLQFAGTVAEIRAAHRRGRIASLLGMEGGQGLENSLGALRAYYDLGVRYMTLTHNSHTDWADSAAELPPRHDGLTPFGEEVVREMNRLGMLVDLSHTSAATMADAIRVSEAPVIFSHSAARGLCDISRNTPDDILRDLAANGGVIMVTFVAAFVDCGVGRDPGGPTTSISRVADHIEYIRDIAGVDHIGIGSDFDGNWKWPVGLSDVSMFPNLFAELVRRGWSDADLRKVAGENLLRVMGQAEKVAARLQRERPASTAVFSP